MYPMGDAHGDVTADLKSRGEQGTTISNLGRFGSVAPTSTTDRAQRHLT